MTAIAALVEKGKIYMGGDCLGAAGGSCERRKDTKVFKNGPFLIGFTSSFRMGGLLKFKFDPSNPPAGPQGAIEFYMNTIFIDELRECLKEGGYARKDSERETAGTFLVGYKKMLFLVDSDYQVGIPSLKYSAIGSGSDLCLGALHALSKTDADPEEKIRMALEAAEEFNSYVRGPFTILSI